MKPLTSIIDAADDLALQRNSLMTIAHIRTLCNSY